jgi:hypothetical protein
MTSPKIDDAMIERACRAFAKLDGEWTTHEKQVRVILEAALSPPEEPEIPVSEAMKRAALYQIELQEYEPPGRSKPTNPEKQFLVRLHDVLCCYRAMEKARRKEAERSAINPMECRSLNWIHRRSTDEPNPIFGRTHRMHRRKDDPR